MGRFQNAMAALRGESKSVQGAELIVTPDLPTITPAQIDAAIAGAARISSIVSAALDWSARNFAEPPLCALRGGEPDYKHPLTRAFARPTDWHSQTFLWKRFTYKLLTDDGGVYLVATLDGAGEIAALWVRGSTHVRPIPSATTYIAGWEMRVGGVWQRMDPAKYRVLWHREASPDDADEFRSWTPLASIRKEVRTNAAASLWLDYTLQNMGRLTKLLGVDHPGMTPDIAHEMQDEVNEAWAGAHNAGKIGVAAGKLTAVDLGMAFNDLDFGKLTDRTEVAVARAFGIPAELLQTLVTVQQGEGLSGNAYKEKTLVAYDNRIIPLWSEVAEAVGTFYGDMYGLGPEDVAFDYTNLPALANRRLVMAETVGKVAHLLEPNEGRELLGLEPKPWGNVPPAQIQLLARSAAPPAPAPVPTKAEAKMDSTMRWARASMTDVKAVQQEPVYNRLALGVFAAEAKAVEAAMRAGSKAAEAITAKRWQDAFTDPITLTIGTGAQDVWADLATAKAEATFDLLDPRVIEAAMQRSQALAGQVSDTTRTKLNAVIAQGLEDGLGPDALIKQVLEQVFGGDATKYRALMIARTESIGAMNEGQLIGAKAAKDDLGLTVRKAWVTAGDGDVRPEHSEAEAEGAIPVDAVFAVGAEAPGMFGDPGMDIQCFPGGTMVKAASVSAAYRRMYDGPVVTVVTDEGHTLTGTPNHPVLTDTGWCALGSLDEGSHLVCTLGSKEVPLGDPNVDDVPTGIEQVFESLGAVSVIRREGTVNVDFHGDGTNCDVEIVRADSKLHGGSIAPLDEPIAEDDLSGPDVAESLLPLERSTVGLTGQDSDSTSGSVSGCSETYTLVGTSGSHTDVHGSGASTRLDSHEKEPVTNDIPAGAETGSDRLLGFTTEIGLTNVVKVERKQYSGHVYNLQTGSGAYIANGIVAHNCRCTLVYEAE